jgi:hypothetical protein
MAGDGLEAPRIARPIIRDLYGGILPRKWQGVLGASLVC